MVGEDGREWSTLTFGPFSVLPEFQKQGIGTALIHHTVEMAQAACERAILIFGDPGYYGRFGFLPASLFGITLPDGSSFEAFMALELYLHALDEVKGKFYEDESFEKCDAESVDAFDSAFSKKLKLKLPGQMW